MAIAMSFASCNDSSDDPKNPDDPKAPSELSGENLKLTELIDKCVDKMVDNALNPPLDKKLGKILFDSDEDEDADYSNKDGSLKIKGKKSNRKIEMKEYVANITAEDGSKHFVKNMSGTLTKTETRENETLIIKKSGVIDMVFDDIEHTIGFDYTETDDYSGIEDSVVPYVIEGTITFDGTVYTYNKKDKKYLKN